MTTILVAFLMAFVISLQATRTVRTLAWWSGVVDKPDGYRKLHERVTPRLGGIAVFIAFAAPLAALLLFPDVSTVSKVFIYRTTQLGGLLLGAIMALGMGVLDDIFELRARWKLVWQIAIGVIVYFFGFRINAISIPLGGTFILGVFALPVTVLWFVGCMNAVNLLDGLDGLAAGACLFVSLTLFLVCLEAWNIVGMFLMACLSGATLGFLVFNFPPAKIFLGDSGSMLLGFLIAALSIIGGSRKAEAAVALFIPMIALGLPIMDTSLTIMRRWYKRLPFTSPDHQHIHHVLVSMGYSQRRAVLTLYVICLLLGGSAVVITFARSEVVILVIGALVIMVFVCIRIFSSMSLVDVWKKIFVDANYRKKSAESRIVVEKAVSKIQRAECIADIWRIAGSVFQVLEMDYAKLALYGESLGDREMNLWQNEEVQAAGGRTEHQDRWSTRLGLYYDDNLLGELLVGKNVQAVRIMQEAPRLLDRLRCEMVKRLSCLIEPIAAQPDQEEGPADRGGQ